MATIDKRRLIEIGQAVAKGEKILVEYGSIYQLLNTGEFIKGTHRKVCPCKLSVGDQVVEYDTHKNKKRSKKSDSKGGGDQESRSQDGPFYSYDDQARSKFRKTGIRQARP